MRTFATNADNDLDFSSGFMRVAVDAESIANDAKLYVSTLLNEMPYFQNVGTDMLGTIWHQRNNLIAFEASARDQLQLLDGVNAVVSFNAQVIGDTVEFTSELSTIFGVISINGNV